MKPLGKFPLGQAVGDPRGDEETAQSAESLAKSGFRGHNSNLGFVWDTLEAAANLQKHGVSFEEAQSVFRDLLAVTVDDPAHSEQEPREIIIGHSDQDRLLFVCFTECAEGVRLVRLISAREATRQERKKHEDNFPG